MGKLLAERALDGYPGWQVAATFRRRPDGVLALLELHVSPVLLTGPENDQEHEITAAMLRSVRLSDLRREAQRAAQSWGSDAAHTVAPELGARPGRTGRDDRPYAVLAARYLELCTESRAPVVELAAETYRSTSTVQNLLTEARRRGLLIRRQGRAGGELTEKARRLLDDRGGD